ncbi:MAG: AAA family ATPase [Candidatus Omnitrophica bacterium]|nr:AAA family ATPase [Candidatus Omnitrophota bacterium]
MTRIIAVTGKGGTGKTTVAALIIRAILDKKAGSVLAVDADPNSTLGETLGIKVKDTIAGICEDTRAKLDKLPAGMSKDRYIEYRIHESLAEEKGISLLTMGRPEGPGCYCYVNSLLRDMLKGLSDGYDFTVIDNEAGMEHISRKTASRIDILFVVSDFSVMGVRSALRIHKLVYSLGIDVGRSFLVVNKAKGALSPQIELEVKDSGLNLAGILAFEQGIENLSLQNKPLFDLPASADIMKSINRITEEKICRVK